MFAVFVEQQQKATSDHGFGIFADVLLAGGEDIDGGSEHGIIFCVFENGRFGQRVFKKVFELGAHSGGNNEYVCADRLFQILVVMYLIWERQKQVARVEDGGFIISVSFHSAAAS